MIVVHVILILIALLPYSVRGHGRLMDPPSRSSMWRLGFETPANYNDNELFCGGFGVIYMIYYYYYHYHHLLTTFAYFFYLYAKLFECCCIPITVAHILLN